MLLTAKMMLYSLRKTDKARHWENAIARLINEGKVKAYDMGGKNSTMDVAEEVAKFVG
jgi:isocitrate/isopropylmalate dehydrogenase